MAKIDPVKLQILMLKKGVKRKHLMKRFKVKKAAVSQAIHGHRPRLMKRIYDYLRAA